MSSASIDSDNQRADRRQNALLPGIIATLDGSSSFDCVIKDFSANGARLTI
jgi:hypothetical protein